MKTLKVSEIFYSLQGEGARAGEASIFVRLSGCSAKNACYTQGVICDTEFASGMDMDLETLDHEMDKAVLRSTPHGTGDQGTWMVWTGGEPLDQLTPEILQWFKDRKYKVAIETSGIKPVSREVAYLIDHIVVSPKVAEHVLEKNFKTLYGGEQWRPDNLKGHVHELRYVRHAGQPGVPQPSLEAQHYYLSPHSDGGEINKENLKHCINLCLQYPQWKLSVQQHKLWRVL